MKRLKEVNTWTAYVTTGDNAAGTLTKAAEAEAVHIITDVDIMYEDADNPPAVRVWNFKEGSNNVDSFYVTGEVHLHNPNGLFKGIVGGAVSVAVAASGAGGVACKVVMRGYTANVPS